MTQGTTEKYLVIGGGGFLGKAIVDQLLDRGSIVSVFDMQKTFEDDRLEHYYIGNICNSDDLDQACQDKTVVIHTASPIHGKAASLYHKVNVEGTDLVIQSCQRYAIRKLIYTSSAGVIYNGQNLFNADETTPYCQVHMDAYNETKAIAEQRVLAANGKNGLLTCALRPSGIFGPRDAQGSLAIVEAAKRGQWRMMIGSNDNLFDMTYVDNAAYAHILAADKMTPTSGIGGEAFTITNDQPVFFWDYPKALYDGLGLKNTQQIRLSTSLAYALGALMDTMAWLMSPWKTLHPTLTRFRVQVISGNRYYDISKAKQLLGYRPIVSYEEAIERTVAYWKSVA